MWLVPVIVAFCRLRHEFEVSPGYRVKARERKGQMWGNLLFSKNSVILATASFPRIPSLGSGQGFPESPVRVSRN